MPSVHPAAPEPGRRGLLGVAAAFALAGCTWASDRDHDGRDAPRAQALPRVPRVAWVLGSGGPRGFVHVGVLRALEELGLAPDLIVGASVGSLVGSLRASGLRAGAVQELALELQPLSMAQLAIGASERFSGAPLADLVRQHAGERLLERMPVMMACVAVRRRDGSTVAFTAGDAGVAVQASSAIEGRFTPVRIRGEAYIDPDGHAPLPVRMARALGARRVLAVDASVHVDRAPPEAGRFRTGDLLKQALIEPDARAADLLLKPDFGYWVSLSREFRERAIAAGYRDTLAQAAALRALHRA